MKVIGTLRAPIDRTLILLDVQLLADGPPSVEATARSSADPVPAPGSAFAAEPEIS